MVERTVYIPQVEQEPGMPMPPEALDYETARWDERHFDALLGAVVEWAANHPTTLHHTGYTYPDRPSFDEAVSKAGEVTANDLEVNGTTHVRRYERISGGDGGQDTFVEHHIVGETGNGTSGVHFDFITDDPEGMLAFVQGSVGNADLEDTTVVTKGFGGGTAPVGKVGLQPADNPGMEVGIMARTHWSDPDTW
jgi:hypothetical protein